MMKMPPHNYQSQCCLKKVLNTDLSSSTFGRLLIETQKWKLRLSHRFLAQPKFKQIFILWFLLIKEKRIVEFLFEEIFFEIYVFFGRSWICHFAGFLADL